jgi:hypothetical protein
MIMGSTDLPIGGRALKFLSREFAVRSIRAPAGHTRTARPFWRVRAVAAESLAVKHQLLIMKRSRRRSPNLTRWDRAILGFCTLLVSPRTLGQDGCDLEDLHPPESSPSPGQEKISFALRLRATPAPGT